MKAKIFFAVAAVAVLALAGWMASCSSSGSSSPHPAIVSVSLSDPPTCASPKGPYSHVYVSISDVRIHQSASAGASDAGWVDLTPSLSAAPVQVDLLALGGNSCLLAQLGANTEIPAGTYQQIRLILAPDASSVAGNQCGTSNNCVVYNGTTTALNLPSEPKTGIKIPAGQIAGGAFTVAAGQIKDLVIDFDACASIVAQGHGNFRLKPVLHAGEVALVSDTVTGVLVDSNTNTAIPGAQSIVALELKDAGGVDRMIMQATPDSTGRFTFCPVPAPPAGSSYDVVALTETGSGASAVAYAATITSGVQPGSNLGNIPMHAPAPATAQPGDVTGLVSTAGASGAISEDLAISVLEPVTIGGVNVLVTIPVTDPATQLQASVLSEATASGAACAANTDCATYNVALPALLPYVGTFSAGTTYAQISGAAVDYTVDAMAFTPSSPAAASVPTCSPGELTTSVQSDGVTPLAALPGVTVTAQALNFTGCL